ncbi:MAG: HAD-IIIA family hydrolase [Bacteroidales bacterium]
MGIDLSRINRDWTLFLDRDGVINVRIRDGYVLNEEAFVFLPGAQKALADLSSVFGRIIVVTNQQGIGKGLMTEEDLERIHRKMISAVEASGGKIDKVIHCPDVDTTPENCRKPGAAMGMMARECFPEIIFGKSIMVGDTPSDMIFARNLGLKAVFVDDGEPGNEHGAAGYDLRVQSLAGFARLFIKINQ